MKSSKAILWGMVLAASPLAAQDVPATPPEPLVEILDSGAAEASTELASIAPPDLIPTADFASRSAFWDASLSPDGETMTFLKRDDGTLKLHAIDPATGETIDTISFADTTTPWKMRWVNDDTMLMSVWAAVRRGPYLVRHSRLLLAYPKEGRTEFLVENQRGLNGGEVIHVDDAGQYALVAHRGDGRHWYPGIFRYELKAGGTVTQIEKPIKGMTDWVADDDGVVRLATGWWKRRLYVYYRSAAGEELTRIAKIKPGDDETYFDTLSIVSGSDRGYVLDEGEDGRVGLRVYDYAKREVVDTVYENPDWDVERAFLKDGEPLAAFFTDDRQQVVWFDETYKATHNELREAIGGRDVWVQSRSEDGQQMLVWAGSEAAPGVLYFFDNATKDLREVAQYRPQIDAGTLAKPEAITYTARDGTPIRAYLTLPKGREAANLPLIILPHGGPFGIRDELRYDDEVQFLANRGYAVLQPNFRGSGGYGTDFYELGDGEVGRGMQDDLDDAMDWAVGEGIADKSRVCVVGGSYGGYAALWAVLRNPERYVCAASWAGVTDWDRILRYDRKFLTGKAGKRWKAKIEGEDEDFDLKDVSPFRLAEQLSRPVLLAHGTRDSNVPFKQFVQMVRAAKDAPVPLTTLIVDGEGHSFSSPRSEQQWYDALDAFLAEHNPAD
ncbi:prolyl oligopeptidase family serine peptidase [Erythrobacter sp. F6033]|uniref:alpha/beta hydrolase family protein n=1 Tax=Erythrobacter sp. F6033 TaxID=2926401 RepID=UPI001FF15045|nr:prolyl oligopeptidase family serine peptidase [Erythrobacter sp. F6033]MCK0127987.1 prolyl oligopeptidase family serine peptidase [Erythrobacter sp. F6033]